MTNVARDLFGKDSTCGRVSWTASPNTTAIQALRPTVRRSTVINEAFRRRPLLPVNAR
jgi:hypothetical protein